MERNNDEVIADMLIQLDQIERGLKETAKQLEKLDKRADKADKRMDLTIRRMVKSENRMEIFDRKLEQSIRDQQDFSRMQTKMNQYFLSIIKKNGHK